MEADMKGNSPHWEDWLEEETEESVNRTETV